MYESSSEGDNSRLVDDIAALLGARRAGLITDIDGTISPIVDRPEQAIVLPQAREALARLREHIALVAVVSGRRVAEARAMVDLDGIEYVGNHGLEVWGVNGPEVVPQARPWVPRLAQVLAALAQLVTRNDITIENKGVSASIHYRLAADPLAARAELLEILADAELARGFVLEEGRMVLNLLPPLAVTKGTAIKELARQHGLERLVYLGDDVTDAHAFRALKVMWAADQMRTLGVAVIGPRTQQADAYIESVPAVAELLGGIVERLRADDTMASGVATVRSRRKADGQ